MLHAADEALVVKHQDALALSVVERSRCQRDVGIGVAHLGEKVVGVGLLIACKSRCKDSHRSHV